MWEHVRVLAEKCRSWIYFSCYVINLLSVRSITEHKIVFEFTSSFIIVISINVKVRLQMAFSYFVFL